MLPTKRNLIQYMADQAIQTFSHTLLDIVDPPSKKGQKRAKNYAMTGSVLSSRQDSNVGL